MAVIYGVRENSTKLTPNPLPMPPEMVVPAKAFHMQGDATRGRTGKLQRGFRAQTFDHRSRQQTDGGERHPRSGIFGTGLHLIE